LKTYITVDFISARKRAFDYLNRFFNVHKKSNPEASFPSSQETWTVELEILHKERVICLPIDVILEADYPLSLPIIKIQKQDAATLGYIPNIDTRGVVCIYDANTNIPNPEEPERLIEKCVLKAKEIIEQGLIRTSNAERYEKEFIAYWENAYGEESAVDIQTLSLINDDGDLPEHVNYVILKPPIGEFHSIIYSDIQDFQKFKDHLERNKHQHLECPTFFLGKLDTWFPPFHINNGEAISIIKSLNRYEEFVEYLNSSPILPIITFAKVLNGRNLIFGWIHKQLELKNKKRRRLIRKREIKLSPKNYRKIVNPENETFLVTRFSSQTLTWARLDRRTSADFSSHETNKGKKVLVAGLGSIGSNLIPYLVNMGVVEFRLVDSDILSLDNIGRHLLGISDVYKRKTHAIRDYLESKNPLTSVITREERVVSLVNSDPSFFTACDYYFFCTGDVNSEMWLGNNILKSSWKRPAFFIWVEPYLIGGHCVYFNGVDSIDWNALFPNNKFAYNFISEKAHETTEFTKQEAGCQTTYMPYSSSTLLLFIAGIYPKIFNHFKSVGENTCYSWAGDLSFAREKNIAISEYGLHVDSFSLLERQI